MAAAALREQLNALLSSMFASGLEGVYLRLWSSRVRLFRFVFIVVVAHLCF
uniref:Uncharacterized protein n=1 Tax=Zea mays TaxID=4577 RepID=B6TF19_MAIZE|nr:hypothetical protein [Zea mays]